jgi:small subunit ribosomal protein S31
VQAQSVPMWDKFNEDELKRLASATPRNAFEEMIQWTNDGILWKFPIDNEQGRENSIRLVVILFMCFLLTY